MFLMNVQTTPEEESCAIRKSAEEILRAIQARNGKPLVILLGESHSMPAHYLLQIMVMNALLKEENHIGVGLEEDHERLTIFLAEFYKISKKEAIELQKKWRVETGSSLALNASVLSFYAEAEIAGHARTRFLLQNNISTAFNDSSLIAETAKPGPEPGTQKDRQRVSERNAFIAGRIEEHIARGGFDMYIQIAGNHHIAGKKDTLPYKKSLTSRLEEKGFEVLALPVFNAFFAPGALPAEAAEKKNIEQAIYLNGRRFTYKTRDPRERQAELSWLWRLSSHFKDLDFETGRQGFLDLQAASRHQIMATFGAPPTHSF